MHVVLHVGAHKTGTSLIQKYYRDNRRQIVRLGIAYVSRTDTNRLIGWGDVTAERPEVLRDRVRAEAAARPAAVLVSHENSLGSPLVERRSGLYPDTEQLAQGLRRACEGFSPRIVFYVRPQEAFIESYYLQTIHQGKFHSFNEWYQGIDEASLRWMPVVDALDRVFGPENVAVGDFGEIAEGQGEFLRTFMRRARLPEPVSVDYAPVRNASVSARGLELALAMNPHLETLRERRAARRFLQGTFSNRTGERARPMPDDVRTALVEMWESEADALAERAEASRRLPSVSPPRVPPARLMWNEVKTRAPRPRLGQRRRQ
jgi:hypothetical protein